MLNKYKENFAGLSDEEVAHVAMSLAVRHPDIMDQESTDTRDGTQLFKTCDTAGLDQADVVMSMARDPSALGVVCLEKIVGRPITRAPAKKQRTGPRKKRTVKPLRDDRIITVVAEENPKKAGTKSHDRFALYHTGMSVSEFVAAGGTRADVKWDAERGYIEVK